MLVARGKLERRQAILRIGIQRFIPDPPPLDVTSRPVSLPIQAYRALIDTGAQRTCLTHKTIAEQRLVRHGNRFIKNVHSEAMHSLFFANIGVFCNGVSHHLDHQESYFALPEPVEVINIADNDNFDAILGMDVIEQCDLIFERSRDFELRLR